MKKIKILYSNRPTFQNDPSGIPFFVLNIQNELLKNKEIDVHFYNLNFNYCLKIQSCSFFSSNSPKLCKLCKLIYQFNKVFFLPLILYFGRYDFYIENEQMFFPLFKPRNTKVINIIYDIGLILFDDIQTKKLTATWRRMLPISLKNSDYILTISKSSQRDIEMYLKSINLKKEVDYIYCDVSLSDTTRDNSKINTFKKFNIHNDYFLFLGTLEPRKNPLNLVKAFYRFKTDNPECSIKLVFAGRKGWLYDDVMDYIMQHSLQNEIIFTGYISDEEKYVLLQNAKAFLFLSIYEGFGIPPLEALKLNTPCLVSDIPVFHELFENNVLYAKHDDINDIIKQMKYIIDYPTLIDQVIFEKFGWDKSAKKLVEFMKKHL